MESFYFEEFYNLSDQHDTHIGLIFYQTSKTIEFIGSMYAPVIINPDNITTYIPAPLWEQFLDQIHSDRHLRNTRYKILKERDPTIGTLPNPM